LSISTALLKSQYSTGHYR